MSEMEIARLQQVDQILSRLLEDIPAGVLQVMLYTTLLVLPLTFVHMLWLYWYFYPVYIHSQRTYAILRICNTCIGLLPLLCWSWALGVLYEFGFHPIESTFHSIIGTTILPIFAILPVGIILLSCNEIYHTITRKLLFGRYTHVVYTSGICTWYIFMLIMIHVPTLSYFNEFFIFYSQFQ